MSALARSPRVAVALGAVLLALAALLAGSHFRLGAIAERPLLPTHFDHKHHTGVVCTTCHHNFLDRSLGPQPCIACHKAWGTTEMRRIDIVFHTFCTDCHRRERAAGEPSGPVKACGACHVRPQGTRFRVMRKASQD